MAGRLRPASLLFLLPAVLPAGGDRRLPSDPPPPPLIRYQDGSGAGARGWVTVDDRVLFGSSRSTWEASASGHGVFRGELSRSDEAWCSVRQPPGGAHDLSACDGIRLLVRGDGRTYGCDLRTDDKRNGTYYEARFTTRAGEWQEVLLPFSGFAPLHMGRPKEGAAPLDPSTIRSFGFVIAGGQHGTFELEVAEIGTFVAPVGNGDSATSGDAPPPEPPAGQGNGDLADREARSGTVGT